MESDHLKHDPWLRRSRGGYIKGLKPLYEAGDLKFPGNTDQHGTSTGSTVLSKALGKRNGSVVCINPHCGAGYQAEKNGRNWRFKMAQLSFECINCKTENRLNVRQLNTGTKIIS
jgi:hypothetical protein